MFVDFQESMIPKSPQRIDLPYLYWIQSFTKVLADINIYIYDLPVVTEKLQSTVQQYTPEDVGTKKLSIIVWNVEVTISITLKCSIFNALYNYSSRQIKMYAFWYYR